MRDTEMIFEQATKRTAAHLRDMRKRYPDITTDLQHRMMAATVTWPDWCWLPMAAAATALQERGANPVDYSRVAALTTWRVDQGVYWLDEAAQAVAVSAADPAGRLDVERFTSGLPQWCCYVAMPPRPLGEAGGATELGWPLGVYVHAEWDMRGAGRPELRLLLDTDGTWDGLTPVWVEVDRLRGPATDVARIIHGLPEMGPIMDMGQAAREVSQIAAWGVWPAVLALTSPSVRIRPADRTTIGAPQRAEPDASGRWRAAPAVTRWIVSER